MMSDPGRAREVTGDLATMMNVSPIQKASATTKVFEALYEMIATGRYARGQKLPPQDELAKQLGVSRNTLREAVNQLSAMGLLSAQQGVGTVVEPPTPGGYLSSLSGQFLLDPLSVREFIEARICIERNAVRLAVARADDRRISRACAARSTLQAQGLQNQDARRIHPARRGLPPGTDARFAATGCCSSSWRPSTTCCSASSARWPPLPGAIEDALRFHTRVTDAIAGKDADRAEQEMVLHLFDVVRRIESNLKIDLAAEYPLRVQLSIHRGITRARRSTRSMKLNSHNLVMSAMFGGRRGPRPPAGNPTSIACHGLMDKVGVSFPEAHLNPNAMAELALAGHEVRRLRHGHARVFGRPGGRRPGRPGRLGRPGPDAGREGVPQCRFLRRRRPRRLSRKTLLPRGAGCPLHFAPPRGRPGRHHRQGHGALDHVLPHGRHPELPAGGRHGRNAPR